MAWGWDIFSNIFLSFFKYILSKDANLLRILEWKEMLLLDAGSIYDYMSLKHESLFSLEV